MLHLGEAFALLASSDLVPKLLERYGCLLTFPIHVGGLDRDAVNRPPPPWRAEGDSPLLHRRRSALTATVEEWSRDDTRSLTVAALYGVVVSRGAVDPNGCCPSVAAATAEQGDSDGEARSEYREQRRRGVALQLRPTQPTQGCLEGIPDDHDPEKQTDGEHRSAD